MQNRQDLQAVGGGKTDHLLKQYKDRKDIGTNKPKSRTQQQPEKERGTAVCYLLERHNVRQQRKEEQQKPRC